MADETMEFNDVGLSSLDYWRLCDELNIVQAALLASGNDPSSDQEYVEGWDIQNRPVGYEGAKAAITRALARNDIEGEIMYLPDYDFNGNQIGESGADFKSSFVNVISLKNWLKSRGFDSGFFFPVKEDLPDYLDPNHSRYSQKLAATVNAWLELEDEKLIAGKSAKQALERWLREHAAQYELSDEEGKPNEKGIEECAKVANWQQKGGAPKTPSS